MWTVLHGDRGAAPRTPLSRPFDQTEAGKETHEQPGADHHSRYQYHRCPPCEHLIRLRRRQESPPIAFDNPVEGRPICY
jgi:hypothetical protein